MGENKKIKNRNVRRVRFSLRYKLLIVLTVIPVITLTLYLRLATRLFEKDKEAYVYDSGVTVCKSLATQIRVEIESFLNSVRPIIEGLNAEDTSSIEQRRSLFTRFPRLGALILYQGSSAKPYQKIIEMMSPWAKDHQIFSYQKWMDQLRTRAVKNELVVSYEHAPESSLVVASRLGQVTDPSHFILIGLYKSELLVNALTRKGQLYRSFLLDELGEVVLGPKDLEKTPLQGEVLSHFFKPVWLGRLPESSFVVSNSKGKKALVSYAEVGVGGLKVASVVDRQEAFRAVDLLVAKSLLFFLALLSATLLVSILASFQLTSTLRDLYEATRMMATGRFDVRVRSYSTDEIGGLADGFNVMATEVSRLMVETAQKARMESELLTVKTVQETLFPPAQGQFGKLEIVGHFEPASECGGDWWNYSKIGHLVFLWIGDATGHGAPAALITSAAKSAAAVIESLGEISPGRALEIMNRAIHETSKGKINMTFFLATIDEESGQMIYANASHDPPYLMRKPKGRPLTKKDLLPLMDVQGPRLGEKINSTYSEATLHLESGDAIVFYTDGIIDLQNPQGQAWGERTFLKTVITAHDAPIDLTSKLNLIKKNISHYRGHAELLDDITLFIAEFKEVA